MKLLDIADVVRSKNSGPYELTFDIIFKSDDYCNKFVEAEIITPKVFANLYHIPESHILHLIHFPPAKAVKITIVRPMSSGALGERDVYGAQQHAPLLGLEFSL